MRLHALALAALAALSLAGCGTSVVDRQAQAQAVAHKKQPLVEWVHVQPEHLAEVTPERLKAEGVALVVVRGVRENPAGERLKVADVVALRNVSNSTIRLARLSRAGDDRALGWGVMIVPPGNYAINVGLIRQSIRYSATGVASQANDVNGHPYVPLSATTPIAAGEVIYAGTLVLEGKDANDPRPKGKIRDERAAAARWTAENLPAFSKALTTRLLHPPVPAMN